MHTNAVLEINWETPAGRALRDLARALRERKIVPTGPIVVFGSGPLQLMVDATLMSGDLDMSVPGVAEQVKLVLEEIGYAKGKSNYYIEVVPSYVFRPGDNWIDRVTDIEIEGIKFRLPDPLDILLGKLRRMEKKDLIAFESVRRNLGRPTEEDLLHELRAVAELFYDRSGAKGVLWENTEKLWPLFFGKPIDVRQQVLKPVIDALAAQSGETEYLKDLRLRLML